MTETGTTDMDAVLTEALGAIGHCRAILDLFTPGVSITRGLAGRAEAARVRADLALYDFAELVDLQIPESVAELLEMPGRPVHEDLLKVMVVAQGVLCGLERRVSFRVSKKDASRIRTASRRIDAVRARLAHEAKQNGDSDKTGDETSASRGNLAPEPSQILPIWQNTSHARWCVPRSADHAEDFGRRIQDVLYDLTFPGGWPELDDLPADQQREIRGLVDAARLRIRRTYDNQSG